jgi:hypothetical protein
MHEMSVRLKYTNDRMDEMSMRLDDGTKDGLKGSFMTSFTIYN